MRNILTTTFTISLLIGLCFISISCTTDTNNLERIVFDSALNNSDLTAVVTGFSANYKNVTKIEIPDSGGVAI